ncbi:MAG: DEAD/DEAH box helicase [Spirochaetota bacterium]|nr:DEAD/DEAH box helicase [Spirochaetota bacterium]
MNPEKFQELGLSDSILKELHKKGFEEPTEIQAKTIPILLESDIDIIGQAQTGTGKTAAFGLPLLERMEKNSKSIQALILVPTRELAIQVAEEINSFKGRKKFQIIPIYGGQSMPDQLRRLNSGVDVVVGTPGRVYDHIKRKSLKLENVSYVVLDEADEMLNMGFIEEVEEILKYTNSERRTLLFSATMPDRIMNIAKKYMREYEIISTKKGQLTVDLTDQIYFETAPSDKFESLCRIIDVESEFYGLIFCRTKVSVDELANRLIDRGYAADGIHGDLSQHLRERILEKFKKQRIRILVATDVAARGIDVENLTHVINYTLPQDPESYIHRIGRTGRAGKKGIAITFISPEEYRKLMHITRITKTTIRKEKLPGSSEIIKIKKSRIKAELNEIINTEGHKDYIKVAVQMLSDNDPIDVVAAILKYSLEDELNEKKYKEIAEVSVDIKGTSRLFVSFGRKDGLTPRKLVNLIHNQAKVSSGKISEVKVMDSFSFITVPFEEAEIILKSFNSRKNAKKPHIKRANPPELKSKKEKRKKRRKY